MGIFSTSLKMRILYGDFDVQGSFPNLEELNRAVREAAINFSNEELVQAITNNSGVFFVKPILEEELNRRLF